MKPATNDNAIQFEAIHYKGNDIIKVIFDYNNEWNAKLKVMPGATWSQTLKCWHVPDTETNRIKFKMQIKTASSDALSAISVDNQQQLVLFIQELQLKAYSHSTIVTYRNEFIQLLMILKNVPVNTLTTQRLRDYFAWCYNVKKLSENTIHSRLNAVKFYFEQVLKGEKFYWDIPRPKKRQILPKVLGEAELRRLFIAASNLKHKAILFVAYSAGLRVSEVINLRIEDIDRERMQLFIHCSKGKKDRYVRLSPLVLDVLEQYYKSYKPKPVKYLFESLIPGEPYSIRSAQQIFYDAKVKAGIRKTVSFHALRHSFATHMLEKGIDVKYIKELLGHFNIKTTERYLHIRREVLINFESPIDTLYKNNK